MSYRTDECPYCRSRRPHQGPTGCATITRERDGRFHQYEIPDPADPAIRVCLLHDPNLGLTGDESCAGGEPPRTVFTDHAHCPITPRFPNHVPGLLQGCTERRVSPARQALIDRVNREHPLAYAYNLAILSDDDLAYLIAGIPDFLRETRRIDAAHAFDRALRDADD